MNKSWGEILDRIEQRRATLEGATTEELVNELSRRKALGPIIEHYVKTAAEENWKTPEGRAIGYIS